MKALVRAAYALEKLNLVNTEKIIQKIFEKNAAVDAGIMKNKLDNRIVNKAAAEIIK